MNPAHSHPKGAGRSATSIWVFLAMVSYLALVKILLTAMPAMFRSPAQAVMFQWSAIGIIAVLGGVGVWLSGRTGFPAAWGPPSTNLRRVLLPVVIGIGFGLMTILLDLATGWTTIVAAKLHVPSIHIAFPSSALIYPGGAIMVEVLYRLFLVPLLTWVISNLLLKGRGQEPTFWILAVVTSFLEPVTQDLAGMLSGKAMTAFTLVFILDYAINLSQAWCFRRLGFLSAILMRVSFYGVWHVLWGLTGR